MLKRTIALTLISMTLATATQFTYGANLPDLKRPSIVQRLKNLRAPMARVVHRCQHILGQLLVGLPIQIEIHTNKKVMRGNGDISALLSGARYSLDQLTLATWSESIDLAGIREINLSSKFPEQIFIQVEGSPKIEPKLIEDSTDRSASRSIVAIQSGAPTVYSAGELGLEVNIVADPENVDRIEAFKSGFRIKRVGDGQVRVTQREPFSYVASRRKRYGGIGISHVNLYLSKQDADVLIFRGGALVYGRLGNLPTSDLITKLRQRTWDNERVELLDLFVDTLPADRNLTAADLSAIVSTMTFSEAKISSVRLARRRMSIEERRTAADRAHHFMTFSDDANRAAPSLTSRTWFSATESPNILKR